MNTWTNQRVIDAILGASINGLCKTTDVGMTVTTVARRRFGSFAKACECAGVRQWRAGKSNNGRCAVDGCSKAPRSLISTYCEAHYYRIRRNGTIETKNDMSRPAACMHCGKPTGNGFNKFCGTRCAARYRSSLPLVIACKACGKEFSPSYKNVCCSDECGDELDRRNSRAHYRKWMAESEAFRAKVRNAEYKRKALKRDAFVEEVDYRVVFDRDNGICWLCGQHVDPSLKWPARGCGTQDHVIPLAAGGAHAYSNVKLAHLSCNCSKGVKQI